MASDSKMSDLSEVSSSLEETDIEQEDKEDFEVIYTQITPYQDEPLADVDAGNDSTGEDDNEEADEDGLTPAMLEARYERDVPVNEWCQCEQCNGALEFCCCREVTNALAKMTFDGSIERLTCITQHEDYLALTNRTVLLLVAPLLRDKNGRTYRRLPGVSENEFIRAVAYRWVIQWICGYMGWENTRPLSACIYNNIRTHYPTLHRQSRGYNNTI